MTLGQEVGLFHQSQAPQEVHRKICDTCIEPKSKTRFRNGMFFYITLWLDQSCHLCYANQKTCVNLKKTENKHEHITSKHHRLLTRRHGTCWRTLTSINRSTRNHTSSVTCNTWL